MSYFSKSIKKEIEGLVALYNSEGVQVLMQELNIYTLEELEALHTATKHLSTHFTDEGIPRIHSNSKSKLNPLLYNINIAIRIKTK